MRIYSILGLVLVVLLGFLATFSAAQGWWVLTVASVTAMILVGMIFSLLTARFLARLIRTETRKIRASSKNAADQMQDEFALRYQHAEQSSQEISNSLKATQKLVEHSYEKTGALQAQMKKDVSSQKSHVNKSALHMMSEIEALIQIYSRFPDTRLPMPPSGGWAIDAQSLAYLITLIEDKQPRLIVELGSGTSSIWMGYLCRRIGAKLITLDHLEKYLEKTRASVVRHGLEDVVESRFAPLKPIDVDGDTYKWYSTEALEDLTNIDMLIVDGPPAATGPQARYPALPVLHQQLSKNATIVLDDAHRPDEFRILEQWQGSFPAIRRMLFDTPRLAALERMQN